MKERLVNATAIIKEILEERDKIPLEVDVRYSFGAKAPNRHGQSMRGGIRKALRCIEQAPTIDAIPVVRCKDCQLRGGITCPMLRLIPNGYVMNFADGTTDNGYCSRGVRKE